MTDERIKELEKRLQQISLGYEVPTARMYAADVGELLAAYKTINSELADLLQAYNLLNSGPKLVPSPIESARGTLFIAEQIEKATKKTLENNS